MKNQKLWTNKNKLINNCICLCNSEDNLKEIKIRIHDAIHILFWNEHPHEQMIHLLDLYSQALVEKVKNEVKDVIKQSSEYIYKNWLWVKWYRK